MWYFALSEVERRDSLSDVPTSVGTSFVLQAKTKRPARRRAKEKEEKRPPLAASIPKKETASPERSKGRAATVQVWAWGLASFLSPRQPLFYHLCRQVLGLVVADRQVLGVGRHVGFDFPSCRNMAEEVGIEPTSGINRYGLASRWNTVIRLLLTLILYL